MKEKLTPSQALEFKRAQTDREMAWLDKLGHLFVESQKNRTIVAIEGIVVLGLLHNHGWSRIVYNQKNEPVGREYHPWISSPWVEMMETAIVAAPLLDALGAAAPTLEKLESIGVKSIKDIAGLLGTAGMAVK